jgi:glutamate 5-kinase
LNKLDLIPDENERKERIAAFLDAYGPVERHFEVSAISRDGCQGVVFAIQDILDEEKAAAQAAADAAAAAALELAAISGTEPPKLTTTTLTTNTKKTTTMRTSIRNARRLVVKVGSALVTNNGEGLALEALADWARQIAGLRAEGRKWSGQLRRHRRRHAAPRLDHPPPGNAPPQAAAAVGQMGLAQAYESVFAQNKLHTAQILLTHADLADRTRYLNARSTLVTLLELGVVPIINENDTVVTDEIKFGDNDTLGALVANLIDADALIILTDQQGLYTADPRKDPTATLIGEDRAENTALEAMAGGAGSGISKGGMITKVRAAQRAARSGAHTCIASGREVDALLRVAAGNDIGTLLYATSTPSQPANSGWPITSSSRGA